jgi:putative SOS response-associated peptidase YedK
MKASPRAGNGFALKADEPRPLFAFPGIYRQWKGPIKKAGPNVDIEVFSFMTTLPNALTRTINHERSPALLTTEAEYRTWLSGTPEDALGLIKPSDPETMRIVQSGLDKEDLLPACTGGCNFLPFSRKKFPALACYTSGRRRSA